MLHFIPAKKLPSIKETAELLLQHVFRIHGFPVNMVLDRGPQFMSHFGAAFCTLVGSTVSLSSGYHPQTNGKTERMNQEVEKGLVAQTPTQWSGNLLWVECAHNSLPCVSIGFSPFECVYGNQPPLFPALEREVGFRHVCFFLNFIRFSFFFFFIVLSFTYVLSLVQVCSLPV